MLTTLAIANYRSLRNVIVPLQRLNLIIGPNGSGKSNVYRALRLLAETAQGGVIPSLAREGGLQSTLWAGPENIGRAVKRGQHKVEGTVRKERTNLRLGFAGDDFGYAIDLGLPNQAPPHSHSIPKSKQKLSGLDQYCVRRRCSSSDMDLWCVPRMKMVTGMCSPMNCRVSTA